MSTYWFSTSFRYLFIEHKISYMKSRKRGSSVRASYDLYTGKCSGLDKKNTTL